MIDITVNGEKRQFPEGTTVAAMLESEGFSGGRVAVEINLDIAQKEGWLGKTGSKWKTMPEQMLMYRAASAFGRLYAPDVMMGFKTQDELIDIGEDKPKAKTLNAIIEEVNEQKDEAATVNAEASADLTTDAEVEAEQ